MTCPVLAPDQCIYALKVSEDVPVFGTGRKTLQCGPYSGRSDLQAGNRDVHRLGCLRPVPQPHAVVGP